MDWDLFSVCVGVFVLTNSTHILCTPSLRRLLQQKVGEMGDTEQQLELRLRELSAREGRLREVETELARVRGDLADARAEVTGLRASMARLDHDKDLLSVSHCSCLPYSIVLVDLLSSCIYIRHIFIVDCPAESRGPC